MSGGWVPNTTTEELMDSELWNGSERELYRRYRKWGTFRGSLLSQVGQRTLGRQWDAFAEQMNAIKEESDLQDQVSAEQADIIKEDPECIFGQDHFKGFSQVRSIYEDRHPTFMKDGKLPLSDASIPTLQPVKQEPEELSDGAEYSFGQFASILDSALQGLLSFSDLMQQFEVCCENIAEHSREEATERHRVIEDRLLRQMAQMLQSESSTWALLWFLFGKGSDEMDLEDEAMLQSTSLQEAWSFIMKDETAQMWMRIVQWLEGQASKALDLEKKLKGWYVDSYQQKLGIWHQTQRAVMKNAGNALLVQHLDPDAPTREQAHLQDEDQKLDEGLQEDIWKLLRAGRLEEAKQLCRSAGQPWRAATLGDYCASSLEAWRKKGNDRLLQAVELESGIGHQRRLWKWACFCASERIAENTDENRYEAAVYAAQCGNIKRMLPVCRDWESACWAMAKSWLDIQVDLELARLHPVSMERTKFNAPMSDMNEAIIDTNMKTPAGPGAWPQHVLEQQPRDLHALFQKLHSGDVVHDSVIRGCKEQHHQIQMCIMLGDVANLLELLRAWIVPPQDSSEFSRPHGHPQMIRFGAHLVLVLRHILADSLKEKFREKLWLVGDLILNTYAIFLFTQRREDLVGVYASQLAPYLCEELYVHMMELRQHDSALVKHKIFRSALEYLPFSPDDSAKGCVSHILDRVLSRSREVKPGIRHVKAEDAGEHNRQESQKKAAAVQWLCFAPPSSVPNADELRVNLLDRALHHSNLLFREFSLVSLWRTPKMPVGAHLLIRFLSEPLKQHMESLLYKNVRANVHEFEDWREYYTFDALYRSWLSISIANADVPNYQLSAEEKDRAVAAAKKVLANGICLLQRKGDLWLTGDVFADEYPLVPEWLELTGVAYLITSSGHCLGPDATVCTALTSALYACAGEDAIMQRQLMVELYLNGVDENCINVRLRCLPVKGDGFGSCRGSDGGLLAAIMATAIKGELEHFQVGLSLELCHLDAWLIGKDAERMPTAYIVQGICRICCLPELLLRCMQIRLSLLDPQCILDADVNFVDLVTTLKPGLCHLFSPRQLQGFLLLERECTLKLMEIAESSLQTN